MPVTTSLLFDIRPIASAQRCDGSVKFVKNSISLVTWRALSTIRGNEIVSADSY